jgi:hypothetical protein
MSEFCESCAVPLARPEFKGPSNRYCKHCSDTSGKLLPREQVQKGIASWLKSWQPGITEKQALERATHYMRALPAWAEK